MLDSVEELRQIHVATILAALPDDLLHPLRGSVGRAAGAKTETRLGKLRIENRRQDLTDGLLNEATNYVWDAEPPQVVYSQNTRIEVKSRENLQSFEHNSIGVFHRHLFSGWSCDALAMASTSHRNRSQAQRKFYGKLKKSGTFFGGNIQQKTGEFPPKNEPDPDL